MRGHTPTNHPTPAHMFHAKSPPIWKLNPSKLFSCSRKYWPLSKTVWAYSTFWWPDPNAGLATTIKVSPHIDAALVFKSLHQLMPPTRNCLMWGRRRMVLCPRKQFRFVAHIAWFVNMRQHVEKLSFLPNQCIGFLGPPPPPRWHSAMEPLIKRLLFRAVHVHVLI